MLNTIRSRVALATSAIILLVCSPCIVTVQAQPRLFIDNTHIDLGRMHTGEVGRGNVVLRNAGSGALFITYVGTSCGCTTARSPRDFLLPGQIDSIAFEFRPYETQGRVEKEIYISTNDSTAAPAAVTITAEIVNALLPLDGSEALYIIQDINSDRPAPHRIALRNVTGAALTITGHRTGSAMLAVTLDRTALRPGDTLFVDVAAKHPAPGHSMDTLHVFTDSPDGPDMIIPITVFGTQ